MERLIITEDGSHSLFSPLFNQQYHSLQGALTESLHIYIQLGLLPLIEDQNEISIFEMGFGSGLNALLAWKTADERGCRISYTSVEAYPVSADEAALLNYDALVGKPGLLLLHQCPWNVRNELSAQFNFSKVLARLQDLEITDSYDLIFYDAFDPRAQPELWTEEIFAKIAAHTKPGGVLVTYSSKGIVKRALAAAGFRVERHRGPGRKVHVLKAIKL
ncbi:tRNA 5-methylaminomethyl-2-thiouridine biosynthesis bifunctional protein MnmC [Dyadobacter sp. CECT 9275]|uniref:tRNA 5-methylaminomethyl-2-thiouridine biosynthesis bifunctional protein MnmC n=1 Tax=Dyadobacter helix TaxID=2822344 RepID=A0A916NE24_9BACT|nr:tRNA (5-methylaminomethyl-2-thiouridine)(34)-methyltransferase MnmD [Dyadobacter sp. CECT 9275]CAG5011513.1 tRNA 5-methylaminomethyl-2-thiouridine biosynthesis bifunctional protein MnmC [Dyadobacter sp. CECT 9275]